MKPTNDEPTLPTKALLAALWQLRRFIDPHRRGLYIGIAAFGVARLFEAMVPVPTAVSINRMADGDFDLLYPAPASSVQCNPLLCCQFCAIQCATRCAQSILRSAQAFFHKLQEQGAEFAEFSIGDMMTRAVADISLIQRLISINYLADHHGLPP